MAQDYIMDQIEMLGEFFQKLLRQEMQVDYGVYEDKGEIVVSEFEMNKRRLLGMIHSGEICPAEDLLFELVKKQPDQKHAELVLWFYEEIAAMDDVMLAASDYSREEIAQGLREIKQYFTQQKDNEM